MGDAYAHALGITQSPELSLIRAIDRFGAQAILGRLMYHGEIRDLQIAEQIVAFQRERAKEQNQVAWEIQYPEKARLLAAATQICMEMYPDG